MSTKKEDLVVLTEVPTIDVMVESGDKIEEERLKKEKEAKKNK